VHKKKVKGIAPFSKDQKKTYIVTYFESKVGDSHCQQATKEDQAVQGTAPDERQNKVKAM
jgi:hypothetical protein